MVAEHGTFSFAGFQAKVVCTRLNMNSHTVFVNEKMRPMSKTLEVVVFSVRVFLAVKLTVSINKLKGHLVCRLRSG